MEENIKSNNNLIFTFAVLLFNFTVFTDFLPYNTVFKFIALILIVLQLLINRKQKLHINKFMIPMSIFLIFVVLNISVGGDTLYICTFVINIFIMIFLMQFPSFSKLEVKIIKIMCIIHLIFAIMVKILPASFINDLFSKIIYQGYNINYNWRIIQGIDVGITKQPGVLAMYMIALSAIFFANIVKKDKKVKYLIGYVLSIIVIFLTAKRSAILFFIPTVIILLLLYSNKKITTEKILKIAFLAGFVFILFYFINANFDVFSNIQNKNLDLTLSSNVTNGRSLIWENAFSLFEQKPIFGMGLKSYYNLTGVDVHNTYLQFLLEMGIVGFLVFLGTLGKVSLDCIKICKKNYKNGFEDMEISTIVGLYLVIFLILYGFVGNTFIDYLPMSLFIIAISMISNDYFFKKEENKK